MILSRAPRCSPLTLLSHERIFIIKQAQQTFPCYITAISEVPDMFEANGQYLVQQSLSLRNRTELQPLLKFKHKLKCISEQEQPQELCKCLDESRAKYELLQKTEKQVVQFNHFYLPTKNAQVLTANITASSTCQKPNDLFFNSQALLIFKLKISPFMLNRGRE